MQIPLIYEHRFYKYFVRLSVGDSLLMDVLVLIIVIIRLIPQGRVDNNLGPDSLAGPKDLDPNY